MTPTRNRRALAAALPLLLALAIGCTDDGVTPDPPDNGGIEYPVADTPEQLMENFEATYANMDAAGYAALLHDDFEFIFLPGDGPSDFFTRAEDLASTTNLFSGEPHTNPDGITTRGINSITVNRLNLVEPWEDVAESYPYFGDYAAEGAKMGYYSVFLILTHNEGTLSIYTSQFFFAIPVQQQVDGETQTVWKLLGQQDSDVNKANEDWTWGELKALFR